jgi:CRISPR-associated protein Cmr3
MKKTTWIEIEPVDTLFFRGGESMEAGENHEVDTMFPPMPATIIGAIRTAIMRQHNIGPANYVKNPAASLRDFPILGQPNTPGFSLTGPLFMTDNALLLPAPAHWYADLPEPEKMQWGKEYPLQAASPLTPGRLGLTGSVRQPFWVHQPEGSDMKTLSGYWATSTAFAAMAKTGKAAISFVKEASNLKKNTPAILPVSTLFDREERTGLAMTPQRTAKEGHLYSAAHIRMRSGVRLVTCIHSPHQVPLETVGIVQLGGEQRVCRYRLLPDLTLPESEAPGLLLGLGPLELCSLSQELAASPRTSGKLLRVGGWDMAKRFHKPMKAWLPSGTVFLSSSKQLNSQLLPI